MSGGANKGTTNGKDPCGLPLFDDPQAQCSCNVYHR